MKKLLSKTVVLGIFFLGFTSEINAYENSKAKSKTFEEFGVSSNQKKLDSNSGSRRKKASTKNDLSFYDGAWLSNNYQLQATVEIISDEGEKTLSVIRWTTSRAYLKSSDKIGFAESAPITSEIELNIENEKDNELLISLFFGVQVPYNVKPKTSSSSRAFAGGYTQFMSFGIETGAQLKLGKPITIWDTETIKLTLLAVAPES